MSKLTDLLESVVYFTALTFGVFASMALVIIMAALFVGVVEWALEVAQ